MKDLVPRVWPFVRNARWMLVCLVSLLSPTLSLAIDPPDLAKYRDADGGLVVIVDPLSTDAAVALARQGKYVVALLDDDTAQVTSHNDALAKASVYPVAQCHPWWFPQRLPFRNNSVNVVILRSGLDAKLVAEAERIIAPGYGLVLVEQDGKWQERRKPRPAGMATWYGFTADGGNSCYAPDEFLTAVNSVQFFHGGLRLRHTMPFMADDRIMVQSAGQIEGRDAFSGVLRWQAPVRRVESAIGFVAAGHFWWLDRQKDGTGRLRGVDRISGVEREAINLGPVMPFKGQDHDAMSRRYRIVSDGKTIYATGGYHHVTAYDAATGKQLWQTEYKEFVEMLAISGDLLVAQLSSTGDSPKECGFAWNCNVAAAVVGIDPKTGKERWRNEDCKDRPSHNLAIDGEKVMVCSFLPRQGVPESRADKEWYQPRLYLQVIGRDSGKTRFFRTDFKDMLCNNSIQVVAMWPGHVGVLKDNDLAVFDARDGKLLNQYQGAGYRLNYPAVSPRHLWVGGVSVPLADPAAINRTGLDISYPSYNHANRIANGMLYSPGTLSSGTSEANLSDAAALVFRAKEDRQALPWDDTRRLIVKGRAEWSPPAPGDWPTLRGNSERTGWASGAASIPTQLAWEQRPSGSFNGENAKLFRAAWRQNGNIAGRITQPVADGTRVLVGLPDEHMLFCYDAATGKQRWSTRLDGRFGTAPTLAGNTAFLGCDDGTVSAIDLDTGKIIWRFLAAAGADLVMDHDQVDSLYRVPAAPVLHDGALYVSAGRHTLVEFGIVVWKLDPADGRVLGRAVLDDSYLAPDTRKRSRGAHPTAREQIVANDIMQIRGGKLCLMREMIDPATMAVTSFEGDRKVQHIHPERGGIAGGTLWVRPPEQHLGYRLAGVKVQATHTFTSDGMILNRDLGLFAMAIGRGTVSVMPLGFDSGSGHTLIASSAKKLPDEKVSDPWAFAGRGDVLCWASGMRLLMFNHKDPAKGLADIAVKRLAEGEKIMPDGIAITADRVFLTTTEGRLLAFDAGRP